MKQQEEVEQIRARMRAAFSTIYLTLLSIIQGVTLAVLFAKVDSLIGRQAFHLPQIITSVGIFLAIVAVWNQYQMGVMLYTWTAQVLDAFIPFLIGLAEFAMIGGIERGASAVLFANGLLLVTGIIAFEHQYSQVRRNADPDDFVHELNRGFRKMDGLSTAAAAIVAFSTAVALEHVAPGSTGDIVGSFMVVAIALGHISREIVQWRAVQRRLDKV